jgi:hypothetical protein
MNTIVFLNIVINKIIYIYRERERKIREKREREREKGRRAIT